MVQWEYKTEDDLTDSRLNELGKQGWELVGVILKTVCLNLHSNS